MTYSDDVDSMNDWLGALRDDHEPTPQVVRGRIAARLAGAGAVLTLASGAAAAGGAAQHTWFHSAWFGLVVGLPVGLGLGAAGHAWLSPAPAPMLAPQPALPVLPRQAPARPLPLAEPTALPLQDAEVRREVVKPRPEPSAPEPSLERELSLLEQARSKLADGHASATLELLRQHRAVYPSSALEQERAALGVRALVAAGNINEARTQAEAFAQRYPNSVLRPSVERAAGLIP